MAKRRAFFIGILSLVATFPATGLVAAPKKHSRPATESKAKATPTPSATPEATPANHGPELTEPKTTDPALQAIVQRGIESYTAENFRDSQHAWEQFIALKPDDATGYANAGIAAFRAGDRDAAQANLSKAVRMDPDAVPALLVLGMLRLNEKSYDKALAALSQAVVLDPKDARIHNFLAVTISAKGWRDGAEKELQEAVELSPDYGEAHFNLAVMYLQRVPPAVELARRHYQKALELGEPADPLVEKTLGSAKE